MFPNFIHDRLLEIVVQCLHHKVELSHDHEPLNVILLVFHCQVEPFLNISPHTEVIPLALLLQILSALICVFLMHSILEFDRLRLLKKSSGADQIFLIRSSEDLGLVLVVLLNLEAAYSGVVVGVSFFDEIFKLNDFLRLCL